MERPYTGRHKAIFLVSIKYATKGKRVCVSDFFIEGALGMQHSLLHATGHKKV